MAALVDRTHWTLDYVMTLTWSQIACLSECWSREASRHEPIGKAKVKTGKVKTDLIGDSIPDFLKRMEGATKNGKIDFAKLSKMR